MNFTIFTFTSQSDNKEVHQQIRKQACSNDYNTTVKHKRFVEARRVSIIKTAIVLVQIMGLT